MPKLPKRLPRQPLVLQDGVVQFRENKVVRTLLDLAREGTGPVTLNTLAALNLPNEDWEQFVQLIGYPVSRFCELSYVCDVEANRALQEAEKLVKSKRKSQRKS